MKSTHYMSSYVRLKAQGSEGKSRGWASWRMLFSVCVCARARFEGQHVGWTVAPVYFCLSFDVIKLDRTCVAENPVAIISEVCALISDNSAEVDIIIYADGLVFRNLCSAWAFAAQC